MEIYIEYVILDNFSIDFCIIFLMYKFLNEKMKGLFAILASIFATSFAIISPFLIFENILLFIVKTIVGIATVFIARPTKKRCFLAIIIFFLITFLFGGVSIGILYLIGYGFDTIDNLYYNGDFPIGVLFASIILSVCGIAFLIKKIMIKKSIKEFYHKVVLHGNGKSKTLDGFLDSGNKLSYLGKGISLTYYFDVVDLLKEKNIEKLEKLEVNTAAKVGEVYIGEIEKIEIYDNELTHKYNNVKLALSFKPLDESFNIILSPQMFLE